MLRARDVWDEQEEHKLNKMAAMRPIIAQIEGKIRQQAIANSNAPYILTEVPSFVFGYPLFNHKDAIQYLLNEFLKAGFWVWNVEEKYLLISWLKPVKSRDLGKPILTTNYRPQVYDNIFMNN
jgi:hypothetical protein|uniref:Uncharacterized protein n=1 Tax=viral metagenome TaxID=1070528 RepID=A0A6C0LBQ3_9ZZZZ